MYKTDIGKDWFIAYINENNNPNNKSLYYFDYLGSYYDDDRILKVKIYYKDLVFINQARKVYPIRLVNLHKLYRKERI